MKPFVRAAIALAAAASAICVTPSFAQAPANGELTRAQVKAQLIEAECDGLLPTPNADYPPSPQTIARNKGMVAARFSRCATAPDRQHDSTSAESAGQ